MDVTAATLDIGPCPSCGRRNPVDAAFCGGCGHALAGGGAKPEKVADPLVGRVIADRYRIRALLGRGGMGVVYKVEHVHIGKQMAMKLLHGDLARDRNTVKRFQREAEAVSRLSHPNTVQVFDFGRSEGMMYLVMEYLEGQDLGELIRAEERLEFERVARLAAQVCASVGEAHELGIVHRDLKPENVMVIEGPSGETAKVLDFGLAKLRDQDSSMSVTRAGAIVGTPYYMSPEQIRGEQVDARGDVYSIGALIYKACTGVPPFVANTPMGVLSKHLTEELVPPSERSAVYLPPQVDALIGRAMKKKPEERYQSTDELREDLLAYLASVGEHFSDPAMTRPKSGVAIAPASATRREMEQYERRLRRRGFLGYFLLALIIGALGAGGVYAYRKTQTVSEVRTAELEPNGTPETANPLDYDLETTGTLGRRTSTEVGDVDLYELINPGGRPMLDVIVTPIPNIDLIVDVYKPGRPSPILSADMGGVGVAEHIRGFPFGEPRYLVRVRERWIVGELPTENVSDEYTITASIRDVVDPEHEVNDRLEQATELTLGEPISGHLGWGGDTDTYCVQGAAPAVQVDVRGVPGVDLVLRVVDQVTSRSTKIDAAGLGEGETTRMEVSASQVCVEVSANTETVGAVGANVDEAYTISVQAANPQEEPPE